MQTARTEKPETQRQIGNVARNTLDELTPLIRTAARTGDTTDLSKAIRSRRKFFSYFPPDVLDDILKKIERRFP